MNVENEMKEEEGQWNAMMACSIMDNVEQMTLIFLLRLSNQIIEKAMSKDQQKVLKDSTDEYTWQNTRSFDNLYGGSVWTDQAADSAFHEHRLGVESYEEYFHWLKPHLREQYGMNDIPGLLFSRR